MIYYLMDLASHILIGAVFFSIGALFRVEKTADTPLELKVLYLSEQVEEQGFEIQVLKRNYTPFRGKSLMSQNILTRVN